MNLYEIVRQRQLFAQIYYDLDQRVFIAGMPQLLGNEWSGDHLPRPPWPYGDAKKVKALTKFIGESLEELQGNECMYCGMPFGITSGKQVEHIAPKGEGRYPEFTFEALNLVLACSLCNGFEKKERAVYWDTVETPDPIYANCIFKIIHPYFDDRYLTCCEIIRYGIDFLSGVHHIHAKNLIHCDIKANNILLSDSDDATLTDFGLAKHLNLHGFASADEFYFLTQAPETFRAGKITHQTDIYQAGLTLYVMCVGNDELMAQLKPYLTGGLFNEDLFKKAVLKGNFPNRKQYPAHIPQRLKNYIRKALEPDPANRYESVLDLLNDLAGLAVPYNWQFLSSKTRYQWKCERNGKMYITVVEKMDAEHASIVVTKTLNKTQQIGAYSRKKVKIDEALALAKQALNDQDL